MTVLGGTIVFRGEQYTWHRATPDKRTANSEGKILRNSGYKVHIARDDRGGITRYVIYKRRGW